MRSRVTGSKESRMGRILHPIVLASANSVGKSVPDLIYRFALGRREREPINQHG
jgi:hypothetical protein